MNVQRHYSALCERLAGHPSAVLRKEYLLRIEKRGSKDPEIAGLREEACRQEPLRSLLKHRDPAGWWYNHKPASVYKKYEGTVWSLLFAAEIGAPPDHPALRLSCEWFMERCFVEQNGAFETAARPARPIACFVSHAVFFLTYFGFADDPRVQSAWRWLGETVAPDGGFHCYVMEPLLNPSCVMALPKLLKAATLLSPAARRRLLGESLARAEAKLFAADLDRYQPVESAEWMKRTYGKSISEIRAMKPKYLATLSGEHRRKSTWIRFQFPLHYDSDLLEALIMFGRLGVKKNPVLTGAAARVRAAGSADGWRAGRSLKGKLWADLPHENDWITLRALEALRYYG